MEDIESKLLKIRLRRDKRIRDVLIYTVDWKEDLPWLLAVSGLLIWIGSTDARSYNLLYTLLIMISWFSAKIGKLHQRIDALIEVLDNEIEEKFASKLKGEKEELFPADEDSPYV
jgi:hypothetical protein